MKYRRDLILGEAFCIFIFFYFLDSRLFVLNGLLFYFCLCDCENPEYMSVDIHRLQRLRSKPVHNQDELMAEWEITHGTMRELVQFSERRKGNVLTSISLSPTDSSNYAYRVRLNLHYRHLLLSTISWNLLLEKNQLTLTQPGPNLFIFFSYIAGDLNWKITMVLLRSAVFWKWNYCDPLECALTAWSWLTDLFNCLLISLWPEN